MFRCVESVLKEGVPLLYVLHTYKADFVGVFFVVGKVKVQSKYNAFGRVHMLNMKLTLLYTVTVHLQCYNEHLSLVELKNIVNI